ncbi:hypothetical protein Tco_0796278 [Tanacetum coccineum]
MANNTQAKAMGEVTKAIITSSAGLSKETQKALNKYSMIGKDELYPSHFKVNGQIECLDKTANQVENGIIELYFVRTEYQLADMFTNALPEDRFQYLVRQIGMRCLTPAELEVLTIEYA